MAKCNSWTLWKCSSWQCDRKGIRRRACRKQGKGEINPEKERDDHIEFRVMKRGEKVFPVLVCPSSLHSTDVCVVVNIPSSPLPDGVKGIRCSPGQRRPHFYMWTAVNIAEWHTTKVGCAAALSLLNGTLAFSFTRVSGTHTSQVFAPKMCGRVCAATSTQRIFISSQKQEIRKRKCRGERESERERMIRQRRAREQIHMHITFHRKDNLHFESVLC